MAKHFDENHDGLADHAQIENHLADVPWDEYRIPTEPVAATPPVHEYGMEQEYQHDHTPSPQDDQGPVEDGEGLRELHDDGSVNQGLFGDGAFVAPHWWGV